MQRAPRMRCPFFCFFPSLKPGLFHSPKSFSMHDFWDSWTKLRIKEINPKSRFPLIRLTSNLEKQAEEEAHKLCTERV